LRRLIQLKRLVKNPELNKVTYQDVLGVKQNLLVVISGNLINQKENIIWSD